MFNLTRTFFSTIIKYEFIENADLCFLPKPKDGTTNFADITHSFAETLIESKK